MPPRTPRALITSHPHYTALRALLASGWGLEELQRHGAHAVGIGRKIVRGRKSDVLALRVYVERKRSRPSGVELVAPAVRCVHPVSGDAYDVPTDVVQCAMARYHAVDPTQRARPVPGGVSCGIHVVEGQEGATGTLGGWAWDPSDGSVVLLSNDHVLGHHQNTRILQPGTADVIGRPPGRIGTVRRGVDRNAGKVVTVDCAIGTLDGAVHAAFEVPDIGPAILDIDEPALDMAVQKFGKSTRLTVGEVDDLHWRGIVQSDVVGEKAHLYDDCIRIVARKPSRQWGAAGDSGSLVFARDRLADGSGLRPVIGLHFGGQADFGFACRISRVFAALRITTLTSGLRSVVCESLGEKAAKDVGEVEVGIRVVAEGVRARRTAAATPARAHARARVDAARVEQTIGELLQRMAGSVRGRRIAATIVRQRAVLVTVLLQDAALRGQAITVLRPVFAGAPDVESVLARHLTSAQVTELRAFLRRLGARGTPRFARAMEAIREFAGQAREQALGAALGIPVATGTSRGVTRPAEGRGRATRGQAVVVATARSSS